jgi:hypothetical protein
MKTILSSRRCHYAARVSILLIVIALIVGMVSCDGCGAGGGPYTLTMAVAPGGSGTATDLTGGSPYAANTVVNITAVANPGYQFVSWSAPAGTFVNATAATTNFTMPAQNVIVTANFVRVYNLTMAVAPPGSGNATDQTNASPYPAGTPVSIQAVANPPYQFFNWTAPAGTFANATAATTTFTMPPQDVTVTAHFVGPLDHFTYYSVDSTLDIGQSVTLEDQFGTFNATVEYALAFCNPAEKSHDGNVTQMWNPDHHFTLYELNYTEPAVYQSVEILNQFGLQNMTVIGPWGLLVPTQKEGHEAPVGLDHYSYYEVVGLPSPVTVNVSLLDQFGKQIEVEVYGPIALFTPVKKTHDGKVTEILNPDVHMAMYIMASGNFSKTVQVANQFGEQALNVSGPLCLLVPSEKIVPPAPPLDHFKCYNVTAAPPVMDVVNVVDQFSEYMGVTVLEPDWFCNPVDKNGEGMTNPDNHLTVYNITGVSQGWWYVEVDNQFGLQELTVYGPVALAAPTWKVDPGPHEPPKYLDHYLLYEVVSGLPLDGVYVNLDDQFPGNAIMVKVTMPRYFANPILIKSHDGNNTGAWDPEVHLVFYDISDNPEFWPWVEVDNQFEYQSFNLTAMGQLLAVPSEKLYYEPY